MDSAHSFRMWRGRTREREKKKGRRKWERNRGRRPRNIFKKEERGRSERKTEG